MRWYTRGGIAAGKWISAGMRLNEISLLTPGQRVTNAAYCPRAVCGLEGFCRGSILPPETGLVGGG